jgi:hypothetical protein
MVDVVEWARKRAKALNLVIAAGKLSVDLLSFHTNYIGSNTNTAEAHLVTVTEVATHCLDHAEPKAFPR